MKAQCYKCSAPLALEFLESYHRCPTCGISLRYNSLTALADEEMNKCDCAMCTLYEQKASDKVFADPNEKISVSWLIDEEITEYSTTVLSHAKAWADEEIHIRQDKSPTSRQSEPTDILLHQGSSSIDIPYDFYTHAEQEHKL